MIVVLAYCTNRPNTERFYSEKFTPVSTLAEAHDVMLSHHASIKPELIVRHTIILGHELKPEEIGISVVEGASHHELADLRRLMERENEEWGKEAFKSSR